MARTLGTKLLIAAAVLVLASCFRAGAADPPGSTASHPARTAAPVRLAIAGFTTPAEASHLQLLRDRLMDQLLVGLGHQSGLVLVERAELEKAIREAALSFESASRGSNAVQVGRMLRADWLLGGTLLERDGAGFVMARIIDARTGIIRDLNGFSFPNQEVEGVARQIAGFVAACRTNRAPLEQKIFVSVGGFENLGVGNHFPEFRNELRLAVEQALQGSAVAMVERTMVNPLLNELRLALGGWTDHDGVETNAQPAFILVDGLYQRIEDGATKINLVLRLQTVGHEPHAVTFKEVTGAGLNQKIIAQIKAEIASAKSKPRRAAEASEAGAQLKRGLERSRLPKALVAYVPLGGYTEREDANKRRQNITEAIEAFEAVLLLEPDNAQAKLYLGRCLLEPGFEKKEVARDYLQEVVAAETNSPVAQSALELYIASYLNEDDARAIELYDALAARADDPAQRCNTLVKSLPAVERLHGHGQMPAREALRHLTNFVWSEWQAADWAKTHRTNGYAIQVAHLGLGGSTAVDQTFTYFERTLDFNHAAAVRELDALLPSVAARYPAFAPHLWSAYVVWLGYNESTPPSPAVLAELKRALERCLAHRDQIADLGYLQDTFIPPLRKWAAKNGRDDIVGLTDPFPDPAMQALWARTFAPAPAFKPAPAPAPNLAEPTSMLSRLLESMLMESDYHAFTRSLDQAKAAPDPVARCVSLARSITPCQRLHLLGILTTNQALRHLTNYVWAEWEAASWARTNLHRIYGIQAAHPGLDGLPAVAETFTYFEQLFRSDRATTTQFLDGLIPEVARRYPAFSPHLWSAYVIWLQNRQTPPSPAVVERLHQSLEFCLTNAVQIGDLPFLLRHFLPSVRDWGESNDRQEILAVVNRMVPPKQAPVIPAGARYVSIVTSGGTSQVETFTPHKEKPPPAFTLGPPVVTSTGPILLACDGDRLWIKDNFLPAIYHKKDGTLTHFDWPDQIRHVITCIRNGPNQVWFGTDGSGLVEVDKKTLQARVYNEADGLVLPNITALHLGSGKLWIGFGRRNAGGVGYLDLATHRVIAYAHRLTEADAAKARPYVADQETDQPPRNWVAGVVEVNREDVWVLSKWKGVQQFQASKEQWRPYPSRLRQDSYTCLLVTTNYLIYGTWGYQGSLAMQNLATQRLIPFYGFSSHLKRGTDSQYEPNNAAVSLALDGNKLWVGGMGYIGVIDLTSGHIDQLCDLEDLGTPVRCLEIDGDEVWAAVDKHLFRVPSRTASAVALRTN